MVSHEQKAKDYGCQQHETQNSELKNRNHPQQIIIPLLVHTGQHYDKNMSHTFFESLGIKEPDHNLEAGGGTHAQQTAKIMVKFEEVCIKTKPDFVLVVGDVNSTIAAGLVAKKLHIKLVHIEAGLRSGDRSMPEEINRLATDAITDMFFTTESEGTENLIKEGQEKDKVHFVGDVMIDNLFFQLNKIKKNEQSVSDFIKKIKSALPEKYICMTMHRPSNVDSKENLEKLIEAISNISIKNDIPIIFPCHPRTKSQIVEFGLTHYLHPLPNELTHNHSFKNGIHLLDPLGYDDFLYLWKDCALVLTDSGGLQEETSALQIPCITIRKNTERPITCTHGTNVLVGNNTKLLEKNIDFILNKTYKKGQLPDLWDGNVAERIIQIIAKS